MSKLSNDVLLEKIENLSEKIERGFEGVHARQDITNGKVIKNTAFREEMQTLDKERARFWTNARWVLGFIGFGTLLLVVKIILGINIVV